jgi:dihydrofolate reductase
LRRIRYAVAMSLDGYIAGPHSEFDWIIADPEVDFAAIYKQYDTVLVGRRTFDAMVAVNNASVPGRKMYVFSRTLKPEGYRKVTIVSRGEVALIEDLRKSPGKDIWLMGGGSLFRYLLSVGLVDTVEVTVVPVLLGGGISLLPSPAQLQKLKLVSNRIYKSGLVSLVYEVQ